MNAEIAPHCIDKGFDAHRVTDGGERGARLQNWDARRDLVKLRQRLADRSVSAARHPCQSLRQRR